MVDERVTTRTDGHFTERTVERNMGDGGGSGGMGWVLGLVILALLGLGVYYLMNMNKQETVRTEAVSNAAGSVAKSADKAATAVSNAAENVAERVDGDKK